MRTPRRALLKQVAADRVRRRLRLQTNLPFRRLKAQNPQIFREELLNITSGRIPASSQELESAVRFLTREAPEIHKPGETSLGANIQIITRSGARRTKNYDAFLRKMSWKCFHAYHVDNQAKFNLYARYMLAVTGEDVRHEPFRVLGYHNGRAAGVMSRDEINGKQYVVIAFRGAGWNFRDARTCLNLIKRRCPFLAGERIHGGILKRSLRLCREIFKNLRQIYRPGDRIAVGGHSMGGAIAKIIAAAIEQDDRYRGRVREIDFNAPKVFSPKASLVFDNVLPASRARSISVTRRGGWVENLPYKFLRLDSRGREFELQDKRFSHRDLPNQVYFGRNVDGKPKKFGTGEFDAIARAPARDIERMVQIEPLERTL
jgi:hypothetical protein